MTREQLMDKLTAALSKGGDAWHALYTRDAIRRRHGGESTSAMMHKKDCVCVDWIPLEPETDELRTIKQAGTRILVGGWTQRYDEHGTLDGVMAWACEVGTFWRDGNSLVERIGLFNHKKRYFLKRTGVWMAGGGWFEKGEVTHWMPLADPPTE
jgi:hypothetical protein